MHTAPGRTQGRSAFTLMETMLALVIVTMLATLVVPSLLSMRGDATADRAKAEIAAALNDARSLARARSSPVIVSLAAADAEGQREIVGAVVTETSNLAAALAEPSEDTPLPSVGRADLPPDAEPESNQEPSPETPPSTTRRLGILPSGCTLAHATKPDTTNPPAADPPTASTLLVVIFPDGTASVPRRSLELTIKAPRTTPRVFTVRLSPWFAEATFAEVVPAAEPLASSDDTRTDAATAEDPFADPFADEVPR